MDFRKPISLFLSLLLLAANTGLAVSVHYCGGEVASVDSGFSIDHGCGMETMATSCEKEITPVKKSCCDEKTVNLKAKQGEVTVKFFSLDLAAFPVVDYPELSVIRAMAPAVSQRPAAYAFEANGPPLYLLYSSRLFYS